MDKKLNNKESREDELFKNTLKKTHKVNLDLIKLCTLRGKFQEKIKEIRKKFKIPQSGFSKNQDVQKWQHRLDKESDEVLNSKNYNEGRKAIFKRRKKFERYSEFQNALKELDEKNIPLFIFRKAIRDALIQNDLPLHFYNSIERYILYNQISAPATNFTISFDNKDKTICIKAYSRLNKAEKNLANVELNRFLKEVKSGKRRFLKEFYYPFADVVLKPYRSIDRDMKIVKLSKKKGTEIDATIEKKEKYKYDDISIMAEVFPEDSEKNLLKIRQARHRLKDAIKKRFGRRITLRNS